MKRTLLIAATAIALSAPAVPHAHAAMPSAECMMASENMANLGAQLKTNLYAKPSEADGRAISVWFHRHYGIGRPEYEAMLDTLNLCGVADPSFSPDR
jgi:hypothetical protein